ncbi:LysM peptidoglycan-binding domain-containing protein [Kineococcus gynurae]|uniref:LysM peptidoglycan-binding domain-containing protein n=1 Tax=Kineococcus gynurae TaxID=452979 RepID=A0ABV5LV85_9ACTN
MSTTAIRTTAFRPVLPAVPVVSRPAVPRPTRFGTAVLATSPFRVPEFPAVRLPRAAAFPGFALGASVAARAALPARVPAPRRPGRTAAVRDVATVTTLRPRTAAVAPPTTTHPLRLTRRGRTGLGLGAGAVLAAAVLAGTSALAGTMVGSVGATAAVERTAPAPVAVTAGAGGEVVVQPGQTLSEIALSVAPGADWREVAAAIVALNSLDGSRLHPGQRLQLPAEW